MLIKKIKYFSLIFFIFLIPDNLHAINYNNTKIIENIKIELINLKSRMDKNLFSFCDIDDLDNSQIIFKE